MKDRYQIVKGDCIEEMKKLPDGIINMILTDPPYGTTACKWDDVIPFDAMWEQIWRVLKPNGVCALFGAEPFSSSLRMSQLQNFVYDWIWHKSVPACFFNAKQRPMAIHEVISIFSRAKANTASSNNMPYNPQGIERINRVVKGGNRKESSVYSKASDKDSYRQENTNYPKSVLFFPNVSSTVHPTQKPIALLQYLIRTYTDVDETVLDFTMGSGSAGVACMFENRKFIGIELDEKYFGIAKRRIERAANPDYLKNRLKGLK